MDSVVAGCFALTFRVDFSGFGWSSGPLSPNLVFGPSSELSDESLEFERFCRRGMGRVVTGCFARALGVNFDRFWRSDGRVLVDLVIFGALVVFFFPHFAPFSPPKSPF